MCLPALAAALPAAGTLSAIGTGLSIVSTAAGLMQQQQAAQEQENANQRQAEATMRAYAANNAQVNLEQQQETQAASMKINSNNQAAREAQSTAKVAAGESGISGLSVHHLLSDLAFKQDNYNTSVQTNLDRANTALDNQRQNITTNAQSAINGLKTPASPDYLGAGLKIFNSVNDYYNPKVSK